MYQCIQRFSESVIVKSEDCIPNASFIHFNSFVCSNKMHDNNSVKYKYRPIKKKEMNVD